MSGYDIINRCNTSESVAKRLNRYKKRRSGQMSDLYTEEIVKKEKTGKDTLIKVLLIAGTVLSVLSLMILGWR